MKVYETLFYIDFTTNVQILHFVVVYVRISNYDKWNMTLLDLKMSWNPQYIITILYIFF